MANITDNAEKTDKFKNCPVVILNSFLDDIQHEPHDPDNCYACEIVTLDISY